MRGYTLARPFNAKYMGRGAKVKRPKQAVYANASRPVHTLVHTSMHTSMHTEPPVQPPGLLQGAAVGDDNVVYYDQHDEIDTAFDENEDDDNKNDISPATIADTLLQPSWEEM